MTIGAQIAAEAEEWVGTPWRWQGRRKGVGCDCKGLVAGVALECRRREGESLEALAEEYGELVPVDRLQKGLARLFDRVEERQAGDVLLLIFRGKPQHLAIAAPTELKPRRTIQAVIGLHKVLPIRVEDAQVHSIWRWRD